MFRAGAGPAQEQTLRSMDASGGNRLAQWRAAPLLVLVALMAMLILLILGRAEPGAVAVARERTAPPAPTAPAAPPLPTPPRAEEPLQALARAEVALKVERYREAVVLFERVLAAQPTHARALLGLMAAYRGQGDLDKANTCCERLEKHYPNDLLIGKRVAAFYLETKQAARARRAYDRLLETYPRNPDLLRGATAAALGDGKPAEALRHCRRLVEMYPDDETLRRRLVEIALKAKAFPLAAQHLQMLADRHPDDADLKLRLAAAYAQAGRPEEADRIVRRLPAQALTDTEAIARLAEIDVRLGRLDNAINKYEVLSRLSKDPRFKKRQRELLEKKLKKTPDDDNILQRLVRLSVQLEDHAAAAEYSATRSLHARLSQDDMLQWARSLRLAGDAKGALAVAQSAIETFPGEAALIEELALDCLAAGRYDQAVQHYEALVRKQPQNTAWSRAHAEALLLAKRYDAAYKALTQLHWAQPKDGRIRLLLARSARELHKYDEARRLYAQALEQSPHDPALRRRLAEAAALSERPEEAETHYQWLIAKGHATPDLLRDYGRLLINLGKSKEAAAAFQKILEKNPRDTGALEGLVDARMWGRDFDDALEALRRRIALAPAEPRLLEQEADLEMFAGRPDRAARRYAALLAKAPENAVLRGKYADALLGAGQAAKAAEEYRFLLKVRPDDAALKRKLAVAERAAPEVVAEKAPTPAPVEPSPHVKPPAQPTPPPPLGRIRGYRIPQVVTDRKKYRSLPKQAVTRPPDTVRAPVGPPPKPPLGAAPGTPPRGAGVPPPAKAPTPEEGPRAEEPSPLARRIESKLAPLDTEARRPLGGQIRTEVEQARPQAERARGLRAQGIVLRRYYGPEAVYTHTTRYSSLESFDYDILSLRVPIHNQLDIAAILERRGYELDLGGGTDLNERVNLVTLRGKLVLDPPVPDTEVDGSHADGLGLAAGVGWDPRPDLQVRLEGSAFQLWDENALAVRYDGYFHELRGTVRYEVTERLAMTLGAASTWYYLGADAPSGSGYAGRSSEALARLDYTFWERKDQITGGAFMDPYVLDDDAIVQGLRGYATFVRRYYHMKHDDVPIIPKSQDYRLGLTYSHSFNPHWGFRVEGFVGGDSKRDFGFGDLYGYNLRLMFVPNDRLRAWVGYGFVSESTTGVGGGETHIPEFGVNINF